MTSTELKADKKKRRRFSAMVATLSILVAVSLYLGITNAFQQDSNTGRIGALERPSGPELANRLKRGIEECLRTPSCLPVFAKVNRAGRAQPTRRNGGATRTPAPAGSNPGANPGSSPGANPSQPAPTPQPPPSQPARTPPPAPDHPAPRPQIHLPPPLPPTVTVPGPVCVPDPLHTGLRICTP